jgi:hypothetical protein
MAMHFLIRAADQVAVYQLINIIMNKRYLSFLVLMGLALVAGTAQKASAEDIATGDVRANSGHHEGFERGLAIGKMEHGVFGVVSAINGSTITLNAAMRPGTIATTKTYTVDATNAKVMKNGAEATIASIAVGDHIIVQGTITGQQVIATVIRDGMQLRGEREEFGVASGTRTMLPRGGNHRNAQDLPTGNGQPVIAGTVTAVSGNSVTISNRGNIPFTIDVTSANIQKLGATSTAANIAVGDAVKVQGSVSGTTITATSFIDRGVVATLPASTNGAAAPQQPVGIWGHMKNFFSRFF